MSKFSFPKLIPKVMFGLVPKEEKFFVMFKEMTKHILEGARLLKLMFDDFGNAHDYQLQIKETEHRGDVQTHEIIRTLNKSFITPFDREDIYSLASSLDEILDLIDASAQHVILYKVDRPTEAARELISIINQSCQAIAKAVALLGEDKLDEIAKLCVDVNTLENEGDHVCRAAIGRLFEEEKDPIQLIKWKEIYESLETAIDLCEDAANILESVVLKHA